MAIEGNSRDKLLRLFETRLFADTSKIWEHSVAPFGAPSFHPLLEPLNSALSLAEEQECHTLKILWSDSPRWWRGW